MDTRRAKLLCLLGLVGALTAVTLEARNADNGAKPEPTTEQYLEKTLGALTSLLQFFQANYKQVNLDAVIGTRIVEGQLNVLLRRLQSRGGHVIPAHYIRNVSSLAASAATVSDNAIPYVAQLDPPYFKKIGKILSKGFWELDYDSRDASSMDKVWRYRRDETMQEVQSDDCIAELLGTGKTAKACDISKKCWKKMTSPGYSGYSLSHQVFYLQIGERAHCLEQERRLVVETRQPGLRRQADIVCSNMLAEASHLADEGLVPGKRDLFMEQAALCGIYGYQQFFNSQWLAAILSWQDPTGCFKSPHLIDEMKMQSRGLRVKREEKLMKDGCLSHKTAVAGGALALYVRYVVEAWMEELSPLAQSGVH